MDHNDFWQIIESAKREHPEDCEDQVNAIRDRLSALDRSEIIDFADILEAHLDRAYSWDLWGAASLMNGGCSDDGFMDFRGWLIAFGRDTYDRALADPDSLADVFDPSQDDCELQSMLSVAHEAFEAGTGQNMPPRPRTFPELAGQRWTTEDLHERYPRIDRVLRDSEAGMPDPIEQLCVQAAPGQEVPQRLAAFFVLSQMTPKPQWAVPLLEKALEEANPQIRRAAQNALKSIQGEL